MTADSVGKELLGVLGWFLIQSEVNNTRDIYIYDPEVRLATDHTQELLKILGPLSNAALLPALVKMLGEGHAFYDRNKSALAYVYLSVCNILEGSADIADMIVAAGDSQTVFFAADHVPELFDGPSRPQKEMKRFLAMLDKELRDYSPADRLKIRSQYGQAIDAYMTARGSNADIADEYRRIGHLMAIVHGNLPHVLRSLCAIGMPIARFDTLIKALPLNNPLTRIFRMLGESRSYIGGYHDVTEKVQDAYAFDHLYEIILELAREKGRAAPQDLAGLLEIVRDTDISDWEEDAWKKFRTRVKRYYKEVHKVLAFNLFQYFCEHEDDPAAITQMREDMIKAVAHICWGDFWGFSERFKQRYNITTDDVIALLAKRMQVSNLTAKDYAPVYDRLEASLREKGHAWQDEVDPEARTIFSLPGTRSQVIYDPDEADRLDTLGVKKRLQECVEALDDPQDAIGDFILGENQSSKRLRQALVSLAIATAGLERQRYAKAPESDEDMRDWLGRWHTLLADTLKQDVRAKILEIAKDVVARANSKQVQELFDEYRPTKMRGQIPLENKRMVLPGRIAGMAVRLFSDDIESIDTYLRGFKTIEEPTGDSFYTGFFDDLFHLMGFMMTGVCTWMHRDAQVRDERYHFGKIALKDRYGYVWGLSQAQLLRCGIEGKARAASGKGWQVIALTGINLFEGNIGMDKERAVLAILETAQRKAKELGMQGAVIPVDSVIHTNHADEARIISELVQRRLLKKVTLQETVVQSPMYEYKEVYLIQIPESEFVLAPASLEERIAKEGREDENGDGNGASAVKSSAAGMSDATVEELLVQATGPAWKGSIWAIGELARRQAPEAIEPLLGLLSYTSWDQGVDVGQKVRKAARKALDALGVSDERLIAAYIRVIEDPEKFADLYPQRDAAYALGHFGSRAAAAVPALGELLKPGNHYLVQIAAIKALAKIGTADIVDACLYSLGHDIATVRGIARKALARAGVSREQLIARSSALLERGSWRVRLDAVKTLHRLQAREAVEPLLGLLSYTSWDQGVDVGQKVRKAARKALDALGVSDERLIAAYIRVIEDPEKFADLYPQRDAAYALGHFGSRAAAAVPALGELLKPGNHYLVQIAAIKALAKIGTADIVDACLYSLGHDIATVRGIARKALAKANVDRQTLARAYKEVLSKRNISAWQTAARELGRLDPEAAVAIPELLERLSCRDRKVRQACFGSLRRLRVHIGVVHLPVLLTAVTDAIDDRKIMAFLEGLVDTAAADIEGPLDEDQWRGILSNNKIAVISLLLEKRPVLIDHELALLKPLARLCKQIQEDTARLEPSKKEAIEAQIFQSIDTYIKSVGVAHEPESIAAEYEQVFLLEEIVHLNIPLVLSALTVAVPTRPAGRCGCPPSL